MNYKNYWCAALFVSFLGTDSVAIAQSLEAFDALPNLAPKTQIVPDKILVLDNPAPQTYKPAQYSIQYQAQIDAQIPIAPKTEYVAPKKDENTVYAVAPNKGPLRMTYYRVPMNVIALDKTPQKTPQNAPIANKPKAKTVWDYFKKPESPKNPNRQRGPWRAIYEDTKTAIKEDVPQAIADYLPWVDYDRKNVPFNEVLGKVANGLDRASKEDPEWAISLKPELMDLARKMDAMSSPPQYKSEYAEPEIDEALGEKSFKKRPIWPGAKFAKEEQYRPFALTSNVMNDDGGTSIALEENPAFDNFEKSEKPETKIAPKKKIKKKAH